MRLFFIRRSLAIACLSALLGTVLPLPAAAQPASYVDANLVGANFENASLQNLNFQNANLQRADLQGADLRGANLRGANLRGANLQSASLQGANFQGAILLSASLQQANSQGTIFQNADLRGANLQSALLYGADLRGANLQQADLFGANLQTANLQNAKLVDANLAGTNLTGANMQGVQRVAIRIPPPAKHPVAKKDIAKAPVTKKAVAKAPAVKKATAQASAVKKPSNVKHLAALPPATPSPAPTPAPVASPALLVVRSAPAPTPSTTPRPGTTLLRLNANRVQFFYDRFLVEADGNVRIRSSNGMTMSGDTFSMDLKLNRFLLAGHVHMADPAGAQDGAALADFLDFDRIYFVPLTRESQSATGVPDRWTFINGDFANPAKGRDMPGDTFYFPDLGDAKPYLVTTSAVIAAKSFVRFVGGRFDVGAGAGIYVPVPSYYVNFSTDQHLGDNSLAGANYDATWEFAGNANAISALHFRYDTVNKTYMSFEQHLSGPKAYAIFSVNPMTRPSKFWSLLLSDRPSNRTQIRSFTQLHTFQFGLRSPLESQQVTTVQATQALSGSFLQANYQFENFSLLPLGCYLGRGVEHCTIPNHPSSLMIAGQTFDHPITPFFHGDTRLLAHVNYGIGFQHDSLGLQTLGGVNYTTIWQHQLGFQVYMPDFKIGPDLNIPTKYYAINASFDMQRQWNSVPHHIDTTQAKISVSKILDAHFLTYLDYSVQNTGDYYGALQSTIYPGFTPVVNGVSYPGYQAFHGAATFHTLSWALNYSNRGNFSFNLLARQHKDFPAPIPFFFQFAQPDLLGNSTVQNYLGQPPYDITADVRMRINPHMSIDIQRAYYFNYSNLRWSPHFVFQVMQ